MVKLPVTSKERKRRPWTMSNRAEGEKMRRGNEMVGGRGWLKVGEREQGSERSVGEEQWSRKCACQKKCST